VLEFFSSPDHRKSRRQQAGHHDPAFAQHDVPGLNGRNAWTTRCRSRFWRWNRARTGSNSSLDQPMAQPPGTAFEYNSGQLAPVVRPSVNRLTGRSALDYAKAAVVRTPGPSPICSGGGTRRGISAGGAGLYLQPRDMAKIGLSLSSQRHVGRPADRCRRPGSNAVNHATVRHARCRGCAMPIKFWVVPDRHVYSAVGFHRQPHYGGDA